MTLEILRLSPLFVSRCVGANHAVFLVLFIEITFKCRYFLEKNRELITDPFRYQLDLEHGWVQAYSSALSRFFLGSCCDLHWDL